MPAREETWASAEPTRLSSLLAHAPLSTLVVSGPALSLERTDGDLALALGVSDRVGVPIRESLASALGDEWVAAIDAANPHHGTRTLDHHLWELWTEPLGDGAVAMYGREVRTEKHTRELLHQLRNPIYGIRAAVQILLRRELDEQTREVLGHIATAADQAEGHLRALERER